MEELLFYKCKNMQAVRAITINAVKGEAADVVVMNGLSVLLARKSMNRKIRGLLKLTLVVTGAEGMDMVSAVVLMEEVATDSLGR